MRAEHSSLRSEFISFWFETRIDGVHRYDTLIDMLHRRWWVGPAHKLRPTLLEGRYDASLSGR